MYWWRSSFSARLGSASVILPILHEYTLLCTYIRVLSDLCMILPKDSTVQDLSKKRPVRAVVFDYGNVLCLEQTLEDMKGMALVCGIPHERFSALYWKLRPPYDRGYMDVIAYWTAVVGQLEDQQVGQTELVLSSDQL